MCLKNNKAILKFKQRFMRETQKVFTDEVNKIALSANDDKKIPTPHRVISYPGRACAGIICRAELMRRLKMKKNENGN